MRPSMQHKPCAMANSTTGLWPPFSPSDPRCDEREMRCDVMMMTMWKTLLWRQFGGLRGPAKSALPSSRHPCLPAVVVDLSRLSVSCLLPLSLSLSLSPFSTLAWPSTLRPPTQGPVFVRFVVLGKGMRDPLSHHRRVGVVPFSRRSLERTETHL